jgi:pimeloyl-ACP methyl ester carboxylesterase
MSKPSILLIPGSFALPEYYNPVVDAVVAKSYEIRALHLPSVALKTGQGREGALPTMYDDAAFIAKEAERLADEGKNVILIGHSYGGVPGTQSAKGPGTKERQKQGKTGGIVNLAYITSLVPAVGMSTAGVLADVPKEYQLDLKTDVRFPPFSFLAFSFPSLFLLFDPH